MGLGVVAVVFPKGLRPDKFKNISISDEKIFLAPTWKRSGDIALCLNIFMLTRYLVARQSYS